MIRGASRRLTITIALGMATFAAGNAWAGPALDILLTNDDGWDSPGIETMRVALTRAGHRVTLVAPLEEQSGKGGSLSTRFCPPPAPPCLDVQRQREGVWSVDSTPTDAVRAGLGAILREPPDLVISGTNRGQNLGSPATQASGTVNAALQAMFNGIPAIAVSAGLHPGEARTGFESTTAAFPRIADFVVRLVGELQKHRGKGPLLPERTVLNINVPVSLNREALPFESMRGVRFTQLGRRSDFDFPYSDPGDVVATGGGKLNASITSGNRDPIENSDVNAFLDGYISISVLDGDMTANSIGVQEMLLELRELKVVPGAK